MYSQEITRAHKAAIVIAIDQSCSMGGRMVVDGWNISKAEAVAMVAGRIIDELILRSKRDNTIRDYYDIAIVGYSDGEVYSLLDNDFGFAPIAQLAKREVAHTSYLLSHLTLNGVSSFYEDVSLWVKPRAEGDTPMYKMFTRVHEIVERWCLEESHRESFPPIVFNITDGEASDADEEVLRGAAHRLMQSGTNDGNTLLVNIHISSNTLHPPIIFPSEGELPLSDRYALLLKDISSVMPKQFTSQIMECRTNSYNFADAYYAMSYNASITELIAMLTIGTRSARSY